MKNSKQFVTTFTKSLKIFVVLFLPLFFLVSVSEDVNGKSLIYGTETSILANTISGTVYNEQRQPVADIYVELQDEFYRSIGRVKTNGGGRYTFSGMREGRYTIKVIGSQFGYGTATVEVEVVNFSNRTSSTGARLSSSEYVQQDIYLQARKNSSDIEQINGVIFAQEIPKNAQITYEKAVSLLERRNQTEDVKLEGVKLLEESVTAFPTYYMALNRLGYEYLKQENFAKANDYLAKAADVNPSEPTVYLLSYSLFLGKNYDLAIEVAKKSMGLYNSSSRIHTVLGSSYRITKKYNEAEEALKKAESLDKNYSEAYWQLALLYGNNMKKYTEAANQLETFLKLQPNSKDTVQIKKLIQQFREKEKNK